MSIIDHIRVMEDNEQWEVRGIVGARSVSTDSCPGREGRHYVARTWFSKDFEIFSRKIQRFIIL